MESAGGKNMTLPGSNLLRELGYMYLYLSFFLRQRVLFLGFFSVHEPSYFPDFFGNIIIFPFSLVDIVLNYSDATQLGSDEDSDTQYK
jgi:hypothetical protein